MSWFGAHPVKTGLGIAVVSWVGFVLSVVWGETKGLNRVAAQRDSAGLGGRIETAPAGASTPSGGLTAPSRTTERNG